MLCSRLFPPASFRRDVGGDGLAMLQVRYTSGPLSVFILQFPAISAGYSVFGVASGF